MVFELLQCQYREQFKGDGDFVAFRVDKEARFVVFAFWKWVVAVYDCFIRIASDQFDVGVCFPKVPEASTVKKSDVDRVVGIWSGWDVECENKFDL